MNVWIILQLLTEARSLETVRLRLFLTSRPEIPNPARLLSHTRGSAQEEAIRRLVENASGLFVWAATACRFIREGKRFVAKRLATILEHCSTAIIEPEKHLINSIYITVLEPSISSDYNDVFGLCQRVNCGHPANLSGLAPKQGPLTLAGCPQLLAGSLGGPRANVSGVLAGRQIGKRRKHLSFHVC